MQVAIQDPEIERSLRAAALRATSMIRRGRECIENVIGHNESLTSPNQHENVPALRTQTDDDVNHADMEIYGAKLRALGGCPA